MQSGQFFRKDGLLENPGPGHPDPTGFRTLDFTMPGRRAGFWVWVPVLLWLPTLGAAEKSTTHAETSFSSSAELPFWGSYAPELLIGSRSRSPNTLTFGVAWSDPQGRTFRHIASANPPDRVAWVAHNGFDYGEQKLADRALQAELHTGFIALSGFSGNTARAPTRDAARSMPVQTVCAHSVHHRVRLRQMKPAHKKTTCPDPLALYLYLALEEPEPTTPKRAGIRFLPALQASNGLIWLNGPFSLGSGRARWAALVAHSSEPEIASNLVLLRLPHPLLPTQCALSYASRSYLSAAARPQGSAAFEALIKRMQTEAPRLQCLRNHTELQPSVGATTETTSRDTFDLVTFRVELDLPCGLKEGAQDTGREIEAHIFSLRQNSSAGASDSFSNILSPCFTSQQQLRGCEKALEAFLVDQFGTTSSQEWLSEHLRSHNAEWNQRFEVTFAKSNNAIAGAEPLEQRHMERFALANVLGGYGYFYGPLQVSVATSSVKKEHVAEAEIITTRPLSIFAGTPARNKFPRPFLWDEGFQLLIVKRWSLSLFFHVMQNWMMLQFHTQKNNYLFSLNQGRAASRVGSSERLTWLDQWNGWIPRELVLGTRGRQQTPKSFWTQDVRVTNPPALLLPLFSHVRSWHELLSVLEGNTMEHPRLSTNTGLKSFCSSPPPSLEKDLISRRPYCHSMSSEEIQDFKKVTQFLLDYLEQLEEWFYYVERHQRSALNTSWPRPVEKTDVSVNGDTIPLFNALEKPLLFSWSDRTPSHVFSSGFDDIPRGLHVSPYEAHLDLQSWMAFFANGLETSYRFLQRVSYFENPLLKARCQQWQRKYLQIVLPLYTPLRVHAPPFEITETQYIFYNNATGLLGDYIGRQYAVNRKFSRTQEHSSHLVVPPWRADGRCSGTGVCNPYIPERCCSPSGWCGSTPEYCACPNCIVTPPLGLTRFWKPFIEGYVEGVYSPHLSYINTLPFVLGLMPRMLPVAAQNASFNSTDLSNGTPSFTLHAPVSLPANDIDLQCFALHRLLALIKQFLSPSTLLSPHGIRSLSAADPLYHTQEDYWRGDIWMSINYLIIESLSLNYGVSTFPQPSIQQFSSPFVESYKSCTGLVSPKSLHHLHTQLARLHTTLKTRLNRMILKEFQKKERQRMLKGGSRTESKITRNETSGKTAFVAAYAKQRAPVTVMNKHPTSSNGTAATLSLFSVECAALKDMLEFIRCLHPRIVRSRSMNQPFQDKLCDKKRKLQQYSETDADCNMGETQPTALPGDKTAASVDRQQSSGSAKDTSIVSQKASGMKATTPGAIVMGHTTEMRRASISNKEATWTVDDDERVRDIDTALSRMRAIYEERSSILKHHGAYPARKKDFEHALAELAQAFADLVAQRVRIRKRIGHRFHEGFLETAKPTDRVVGTSTLTGNRRPKVWKCSILFTDGQRETLEEEEFLECLRRVSFAKADSVSEKLLQYRTAFQNFLASQSALQRTTESAWKKDLIAQNRIVMKLFAYFSKRELDQEKVKMLQRYSIATAEIRENLESLICATVLACLFKKPEEPTAAVSLVPLSIECCDNRKEDEGSLGGTSVMRHCLPSSGSKL